MSGRKASVDRKRFPHDYTGPSTRFGLDRGTPCRIVGNKAGGRVIETAGGKRWVVGREQVTHVG